MALAAHTKAHSSIMSLPDRSPAQLKHAAIRSPGNLGNQISVSHGNCRVALALLSWLPSALKHTHRLMLSTRRVVWQPAVT